MKRVTPSSWPWLKNSIKYAFTSLFNCIWLMKTSDDILWKGNKLRSLANLWFAEASIGNQPCNRFNGPASSPTRTFHTCRQLSNVLVSLKGVKFPTLGHARKAVQILDTIDAVKTYLCSCTRMVTSPIQIVWWRPGLILRRILRRLRM